MLGRNFFEGLPVSDPAIDPDELDTDRDMTTALTVLRQIASDPRAASNARIRAALALADLCERERVRQFNAEQLDGLGLKPFPVA